MSVHRHWTYVTPNKGFLKKLIGHASFLPSSRGPSLRNIKNADVTIGSSPTFFAAMAARRLARRSGVPFFMEVRDLWPAAFVELGVLKNPLLIRMLEIWEMSLYRSADRVVTVTEEFRSNLVQRGIPGTKVVNIPNGADTEYWKPGLVSDSFGAKQELKGKFVVLYIGAHGISQALSKVLEAASLLRAHGDIVFQFVGEGAEKEELVRKTLEMGLKNVRFHEPVGRESVREFYRLAGVTLVPLRNIPLFRTFIPSKMFEMMACGCPIVASLEGEAGRILTDSNAAVVVPPENPEALAREIIRLRDTPSERESMKKNGPIFVRNHYSRRALADKYLIEMNQAIMEHRAS